ncbi:2,3-bisphosphoglycerate-independent phosphoglycerate mutase [Candidatus Dependentiae bacterium]|nr:2,3-bisphosphoglycerate-independent phosphoglycerate mutase [Candidatus Dependentiae bacterium]
MIQREINRDGVRPTMLLIFDGFGYREERGGNAIAHAAMPTWDMLQRRYPHELLKASGRAVGLPDGFMGNSEVGHMTIGAGRPIMTPLCKFHDSIDNKTFFKNKLLIEKFTQLKETGHALHLLGLLSDAGVHSHDRHIHELLRLAKMVGVKKTFIHAFLDGRDTPPKSAQLYLDRLQKHCDQANYGAIASLHGRFYAMDRDNNWDRVQKSYEVLCGTCHRCFGVGDNIDSRMWQEVIHDCYSRGVYDEFIEPVLLSSEDTIREGDGLFFTNFRPDRMRQLTECFLDPSFNKFASCGLTATNGKLAFVFSTTRYSKSFENFTNTVLFEDEVITPTLLDLITKKIFIIAETEKYAHVTYFFRGKVDIELALETRVLIPSIKARTYINHPDMSAYEITARIIESLRVDPAYFYLVNYANCDMVGHSGDFEATVKACECLDKQLKVLYEEVVEKLGGTIFLVSDHGNAEEMIDLTTGRPKTAHTCNPVPFVTICKSLVGDYKKFDQGNFETIHGLSIVSPTILRHLGLRVPEVMKDAKFLL